MKIFTSILFLYLSLSPVFGSLNKVSNEESAQKILNQDKSFSVIIFMNRMCPCTNHNIEYLNDLSKKYGQIHFQGVHAVKNTKDELVIEYKKSINR